MAAARMSAMEVSVFSGVGAAAARLLNVSPRSSRKTTSALVMSRLAIASDTMRLLSA
ncbi:hypothetical protein [Bradyrhizobium sp. USDA 4471]